MHYLLPIMLTLAFSLVLTVGLLSVMQDLTERTAEAPLIRETDSSLFDLTDDVYAREWRTQVGRPARGPAANFEEANPRRAAASFKH